MTSSIAQAPPIPSKYDIIPIHTSDRATFKFCRRKWAWSSPSRRNLVPRTEIHGVVIPLWFGSGIHYALEKFYDPVLKQDPVVTFESWYNLQWNGGLITEDELDRFYDREPKHAASRTDEWNGVADDGSVMPTPLYMIRGLSELLPDPDPEVFEAHRQLGIGMLTFYKEYAAREDNFDVIAVEHNFSVPILSPSTGEALYMSDTRRVEEDWEPDITLENEYGPLMVNRGYFDKELGTRVVKKQVHARGRMDLIIQDHETERYGVKDYKTTARLDEDYFRHLDLDEQVTSYLTFGEIEARMYGLPYQSLDFIIYEALLKAYPKSPTMTSRGLPSINRQEESTTAELFEQCIKQNGLDDIFASDEKMQSYYAWLLDIGDRRFIDRHPVWRNRAQRNNAASRIYYEAIDMLSDPVLYPNPTKAYPCLNCQFRAPCVQVEDGSDYESTLSDGYEPNWDR